jgi:hypothetical protein
MISAERLKELIAIAEHRRIDGSDWRDEVSVALRELEAGRTRIAELERDASRYRFVRSNSPDFGGAPVVAVLLSAGLYWLTASEADKRIDAAILRRLGGQTT